MLQKVSHSPFITNNSGRIRTSIQLWLYPTGFWAICVLHFWWRKTVRPRYRNRYEVFKGYGNVVQYIYAREMRISQHVWEYVTCINYHSFFDGPPMTSVAERLLYWSQWPRPSSTASFHVHCQKKCFLFKHAVCDDTVGKVRKSLIIVFHFNASSQVFFNS